MTDKEKDYRKATKQLHIYLTEKDLDKLNELVDESRTLLLTSSKVLILRVALNELYKNVKKDKTYLTEALKDEIVKKE